MIAPHNEDDEDAIVNLPQLVEIVAGNTPQFSAPEPDEIETTISLPTTEVENTETTDESSVTELVEDLTTTTERPFLLPISG